MDEQSKTTPEQEVKPAQTIEEALSEPKEEKKSPQTVGLDKFLELKRENKEMSRKMKELENAIAEGASNKEIESISDDIETIAKEHNVDGKFLNKLVSSIRKDIEKDVEERVAEKFKPIEAQEKASKLDKLFVEHFNNAMKDLPEYAEIVNPEVIKSLSFDPKNQNKTFVQLIEETYSKSLSGKKTTEKAVPRGGKEVEDIDYNKAAKDKEYFKEIMADPAARKKYNSNLEKRINL